MMDAKPSSTNRDLDLDACPWIKPDKARSRQIRYPRDPARRWIRPLSRGPPKAHRPFLGRDPPRLDAGDQLKLGNA